MCNIIIEDMCTTPYIPKPIIKAKQNVTMQFKTPSKNMFKRSASCDEGTLIVSRSVQTVETDVQSSNNKNTLTHSGHIGFQHINNISNRINGSEGHSVTDELYTDLCKSLEDVRSKISQLTSKLGPNNIVRVKGLAKIKEHCKDIISTIEIREQIIVTDSQNLLQDFEHSWKPENCLKANLLSNKAKSWSKTEERYTKETIEDLLRLHVFPQCKQQYFPFTLQSYFESFRSGQPVDANQSMTHELLRLSSLSTFPRDIDISMTRLARSGFYCTNTPGETKCYACGITYNQWRSGDDPFKIHSRISSTCTMVTTQRQPQLSISENVAQNSPSSSQSSRINPERLEQQNNSITDNSGIHLNDSVSSPTEYSITETSEVSELTAMHQIQLSCTGNRDLTGNTTSSTQPSQSNHSQNNGFSDLGVNIEKPRYPNYAPLQTRISSYQGWPPYLDQTPRQMALAGFLYAGYNDYTRCFFCGGGLRNWEAGDDPWVEHARWFPQCAFLKQNKGEKFINAVLKKQHELEREKAENIPSSASQLPANISTEQHDDPLNSIAARSVLEMGYTNDQVRGALQRLNRTITAASNISATDIMNVLLNDEDDQSTQGAASVAESTETKTSKELEIGQQSELTDATSLIEENRQLRDQRLCKVCLDLEASIAFLPCGHIACCSDCAPAMRKCPLCRTYIKGTVKTYLA